MSGTGVQLEEEGKKTDYMKKLIGLMEEYPRLVMVTCDNIGSHHMQRIRTSLRGRAVILMGKNTLMRKAIKASLEVHPDWESILPSLKGNVGLVFTKEPLVDIRPKLLESRVPAQAKAGIIAPQDVTIPKGITTLEPTKTTFFAALDIATKITRGSVEILNDVHLCREGERVGSSEAALMAMLDIKPFTYGLKLTTCFDEGFAFPASLLDTTSAHVFQSFAKGVSQIAALSLALSYPSLAAFPHVVLNAFKNLVAVSLETKYVFEQAKQIKERVENPEAFAVAATAPETTSAAPVEATPAPAASETSSEEEIMDDIFGF